MSATVLPETPGRVGQKLRIQARLAVLTAHVLTRLPPGILERAMTAVVAQGARPEPSVAGRYRSAVVSVSSICAGYGCLPRSVATALLARLNGHAVSWFTGIRDAPFAAHAWVTVGDVLVGEPADVATFAIVLSARPRYDSSSLRREAATDG